MYVFAATVIFVVLLLYLQKKKPAKMTREKDSTKEEKDFDHGFTTNLERAVTICKWEGKYHEIFE